MRKIYKLFAVFVAIAAVAFWMQAPESFASGNQASGATAKVDLNSASAKDLEELPGVGEATAKKIIAGRPYSSTSDLSKAGVSAATIKKITPLVTFGGAAPRGGVRRRRNQLPANHRPPRQSRPPPPQLELQ